jgi:hypothetical protein
VRGSFKKTPHSILIYWCALFISLKHRLRHHDRQSRHVDPLRSPELPFVFGTIRLPGLEFEGRATIEGDWAERVTRLHSMRVEMGMMRTPHRGNRC